VHHAAASGGLLTHKPTIIVRMADRRHTTVGHASIVPLTSADGAAGLDSRGQNTRRSPVPLSKELERAYFTSYSTAGRRGRGVARFPARPVGVMVTQPSSARARPVSRVAALRVSRLSRVTGQRRRRAGVPWSGQSGAQQALSYPVQLPPVGVKMSQVQPLDRTFMAAPEAQRDGCANNPRR
jgi:hypothetical protein